MFQRNDFFVIQSPICFDKPTHYGYALFIDLFTDGHHKTTEGGVFFGRSNNTDVICSG
jgi:hypothetical protein